MMNKKNYSQGSNDDDSSIISGKPSLIWSCIARNDIILAEAGEDVFQDGAVIETAQQLLQKKPTPGWEFHTEQRKMKNSFAQHFKKDRLKGIKFHIYDRVSNNNDQQKYNDDNDDPELYIWVIACLYDPTKFTQKEAQAFIEKIITLTEIPRQHDDAWKYGDTLELQHAFAPVLLQQMQQVAHTARMSQLQTDMDVCRTIMSQNIEAILNRGEKLDELQEDATRLQEMTAVFQKRAKSVKRKVMWQNAKHGLVMGTAISAGVAAIVAPTLIAIL